MHFIVTLLMAIVAAGVWGFLSTLLIGSPPLTGIGAALIGIFILGFRSKDKEKGE